jgi:hypothetical protein
MYVFVLFSVVLLTRDFHGSWIVIEGAVIAGYLYSAMLRLCPVTCSEAGVAFEILDYGYLCRRHSYSYAITPTVNCKDARHMK